VRPLCPEPLHQDLELYARYFAQASGRQARSMTDVIVGVLGEYLGTDQGFVAWKRSNPNPDSAESPFSTRAESRISSSDEA
jgi:hypothetical protein